MIAGASRRAGQNGVGRKATQLEREEAAEAEEDEELPPRQAARNRASTFPHRERSATEESDGGHALFTLPERPTPFWSVLAGRSSLLWTSKCLRFRRTEQKGAGPDLSPTLTRVRDDEVSCVVRVRLRTVMFVWQCGDISPVVVP